MSRWKHVVFSAAIYRLTVSTDSSLSVAEIRCLSDHQDQIRSLINVNGQSDRKQSVASSSSDIQLPPGSGDKLLTHFQPITAGSVWPRSYCSASFTNNKKHCRRIQLQPKHNVKEVYSNPNMVMEEVKNYIFINIVSEELHAPIFQIFTWFYKVLSSESRQQTFIVLFHLNLQRQTPPLSYLSQ